MRNRSNDRIEIEGIDSALAGCFALLICIGWIAIYAVSYEETKALTGSQFLFGSIAGKQTIWVGVSFIIFIAVQIIDWKFWRTFAYVVFIFSLLLLFLVLIFGNTIKGATSWFAIGGFTFQPSEFAKFGTCLAMASYLSTYSTNLKLTKYQFTAFALIGAPMFLILLQPDAGSALVFLSFFLLLFREGLPETYYLIGGFVAIMFILGLVYPVFYIVYYMVLLEVFLLGRKNKLGYYGLLIGVSLLIFNVIVYQENLWMYGMGANVLVWCIAVFLRYQQKENRVISLSIAKIGLAAVIVFAANFFFNNILKPHQQDRINVWLNPSKCDPRGSLYNILQSKMAIGSGGLNGKGFLEGTMTKLNYVPEQSTDFIFCTIGEEHGFIGTSVVILIYMFLLLRILKVGERQRSEFSRHYAYGVAGILFIHLLTNVGMTMGLMPVIGIPLPFISYGGSSLMGFTLLVAVLIKLDSKRSSI